MMFAAMALPAICYFFILGPCTDRPLCGVGAPRTHCVRDAAVVRLAPVLIVCLLYGVLRGRIRCAALCAACKSGTAGLYSSAFPARSGAVGGLPCNRHHILQAVKHGHTSGGRMRGVE